MFTYAEEFHCLWNLEYLCRKKALKEITSFQKAVSHYERQNYQIAIDDFGKGYASFNRVFFLRPKYVKIDISLISNIDTDSVKSSLVEGFVKFCHNEKIYLIAEGIETEEELRKLIRLGVDYGQGYFLGKPNKELQQLPSSILELIKNENVPAESIKMAPTFFDNIGSICHQLGTTTSDTKALAVFEFMQKNPDITELCVVDQNKKD